jgi:hypothetical protein
MRFLRGLAAALSAAVILPAHAVTAWFEHPYGELVDVGPTTIHVSPWPGHSLDCTATPSVTFAGRELTIVLRGTSNPPPSPPPPCATTRAVDVGALAAGWWLVQIVVSNGYDSPPLDRAVFERYVARPESTCNRYASLLAPKVVVAHRTLSPEALVQRIATDPAYRARLGDPVDARKPEFSADVQLIYPDLANPHDKRAQVLATGEFASAWADDLACFATSPPDQFAVVVEYYHAGLDQYFYTWLSDEIEALDRGAVLRGWARTGESFRVLTQPGCAPSVPENVAYRFWGKPGVGPTSHFFTAIREECRIVDRIGQWLYEGAAFWAVRPDARGGCSDPGRIPLYRAWKPFGDTNHRYTTDRATVDAMTARGWVDEGAAMCVRAP